MLLKNYRKEVFRAKCNTSFQSVHCIAKLDGYEYLQDSPPVTFKSAGKLITVQGREIAVNALQDEQEAEKILRWLKREINAVWERRSEIEPSFESAAKPQVIDILRHLPRTNCRECGLPTCLVFATMVAQGVKTAHACPPIASDQKRQLDAYLEGFQLDL